MSRRRSRDLEIRKPSLIKKVLTHKYFIGNATMPGMKLFSVLVQRTTQHVISLLFIFLRPSSSLHASGYDCGQGMKVKGKGTAKSWETPRSIVKKKRKRVDRGGGKSLESILRQPRTTLLACLPAWSTKQALLHCSPLRLLRRKHGLSEVK